MKEKTDKHRSGFNFAEGTGYMLNSNTIARQL